jgi:hypothetical protein
VSITILWKARTVRPLQARRPTLAQLKPRHRVFLAASNLHFPLRDEDHRRHPGQQRQPVNAAVDPTYDRERRERLNQAFSPESANDQIATQQQRLHTLFASNC